MEPVSIKQINQHGKFFGGILELESKLYELVIAPTHNYESVIDKNNLEKYFSPKSILHDPPTNTETPYQVEVPLHHDGSCVAKCHFCGYGGKKATFYSKSETIISLFEKGIDIALNYGLVKNKKSLKLGLLKGGDLSLNKNLETLLYSLSEKFLENKIKISSIAAKKYGFFESMLNFKKKSSQQKISLQISLNSTCDYERERIVNGNGPNKIKLYCLDEINNFANEWKEVYGRKLTLTSTLEDKTIFDTNVIKEKFDPDNVILKLRKVNPISNEIKSISKKKYTETYFKLVNLGYTVIIGNPTYSELTYKLTPRGILEKNKQ
jgi:hypothetical protein